MSKRNSAKFDVFWFVHIHNEYQIIPGKLSPAFPSAMPVVGNMSLSMYWHIYATGLSCYLIQLGLWWFVYLLTMTRSTSRPILKPVSTFNSQNAYTSLQYDVLACRRFSHYWSCVIFHSQRASLCFFVAFWPICWFWLNRFAQFLTISIFLWNLLRYLYLAYNICGNVPLIVFKH